MSIIKNVITIIIPLIGFSFGGCSPALQVNHENGRCTGGWGLSAQERINACGTAQDYLRAGQAKRQADAEQSKARYEAQNREIEAQAIAAQAAASPALLEYEQRVEPIFKISGLVTKTNICGLRSDLWSRRIQNGLALAVQREDNAGLTMAEKNAANSNGNEVVMSAARSMSCDSMANSPALQDLDRLDYQMTGGYH